MFLENCFLKAFETNRKLLLRDSLVKTSMFELQYLKEARFTTTLFFLPRTAFTAVKLFKVSDMQSST